MYARILLLYAVSTACLAETVLQPRGPRPPTNVGQSFVQPPRPPLPGGQHNAQKPQPPLIYINGSWRPAPGGQYIAWPPRPPLSGGQYNVQKPRPPFVYVNGSWRPGGQYIAWPLPPSPGGDKYPRPPTTGGQNMVRPTPPSTTKETRPPTTGGQYMIRPTPPSPGGDKYPRPPTTGGQNMVRPTPPSTEGGKEPRPPTAGGQYTVRPKPPSTGGVTDTTTLPGATLTPPTDPWEKNCWNYSNSFYNGIRADITRDILAAYKKSRLNYNCVLEALADKRLNQPSFFKVITNNTNIIWLDYEEQGDQIVAARFTQEAVKQWKPWFEALCGLYAFGCNLSHKPVHTPFYQHRVALYTNKLTCLFFFSA